MQDYMSFFDVNKLTKPTSNKKFTDTIFDLGSDMKSDHKKSINLIEFMSLYKFNKIAFCYVFLLFGVICILIFLILRNING
jgi:hypothetical protein